ncbi:hypothetical protein Tco_1341044 [Tanacetum coccineum]
MEGSMKGSMGGCNRYSRKLFRRVYEQMNWYMFRTEGRFKASRSFETIGSFIFKLSISVTDLIKPWEASSWEPWGFSIGAWCGFDVPSQGLKRVI